MDQDPKLLKFIKDRLFSYPEFEKFMDNCETFDGVVAGGAVANLIIEYYFNIEAKINDVDIFLKEAYNPREDRKITDDRFYYCSSHIKITRVQEKDILNIIRYNDFNDEEMIFSLLDSFDLNVCQVGYDWKNDCLFVHPNFEKFLKEKIIKVNSTKNPYKTLARILSKKEDYKDFFKLDYYLLIDLCCFGFYEPMYNFFKYKFVVGELIFTRYPLVRLHLAPKHQSILLKNKELLEKYSLIVKDKKYSIQEFENKIGASLKKEQLKILSKVKGRQESPEDVVKFNNDTQDYLLSIECNQKHFEERISGVFKEIVTGKTGLSFLNYPNKRNVDYYSFKLFYNLMEGKESFQRRKIFLLKNLLSRSAFHGNYLDIKEKIKYDFDHNKLQENYRTIYNHVSLKDKFVNFLVEFDWSLKDLLWFYNKMVKKDSVFIGMVESYNFNTNPKKRTPKELIKHLEKVQKARFLKYNKNIINRLDISDFDYSKHIKELLSEYDLKVEGEELSHCVGGYGGNLRSGTTRIFSLSFRGERTTLELFYNKENILVRQHYGKRNKSPNYKSRFLAKKFVKYLRKDHIDKFCSDSKKNSNSIEEDIDVLEICPVVRADDEIGF